MMKVTDEMVMRFLGWKLPEDFHPDAGISFSPYFNVEYNAKHGKPPNRHEPVGTNLFTADQAKAMLEHVLQSAQSETQDTVPRSRYDACNQDWLDTKAELATVRQNVKAEFERLREGLEAILLARAQFEGQEDGALYEIEHRARGLLKGLQ
jgi:hypothetical protein